MLQMWIKSEANIHFSAGLFQVPHQIHTHHTRESNSYCDPCKNAYVKAEQNVYEALVYV